MSGQQNESAASVGPGAKEDPPGSFGWDEGAKRGVLVKDKWEAPSSPYSNYGVAPENPDKTGINASADLPGTCCCCCPCGPVNAPYGYVMQEFNSLLQVVNDGYGPQPKVGEYSPRIALGIVRKVSSPRTSFKISTKRLMWVPLKWWGSPT